MHKAATTPPSTRSLSLPLTLRRALPALLAIWSAAFLAVAALDWADYRVFLQLLLVAR